MSLLSFIIECLKKPRMVGAVAPSSPALMRAMLKPVNWQHARTIVEFGPGTGVMTKGILARMRPDATLVAYELNPKFVKKLPHGDKRLTVKQQSAALMTEKPDVIISSLPLLAMPKNVAEHILSNAQHATKQFIQFQYTHNLEPLIAKHFTFTRSWVAKNLPPAFVYACTPKQRKQPRKSRAK